MNIKSLTLQQCRNKGTFFFLKKENHPQVLRSFLPICCRWLALTCSPSSTVWEMCGGGRRPKVSSFQVASPRLQSIDPVPDLMLACVAGTQRKMQSVSVCVLVRVCYGLFQFSPVAQSCLTLCDPMNRSTPGLPVHHQLLEFTLTHAHRVGDAIQPSHPLSAHSPPAPNPSQHQGLFQ